MRPPRGKEQRQGSPRRQRETEQRDARRCPHSLIFSLLVIFLFLLFICLPFYTNWLEHQILAPLCQKKMCNAQSYKRRLLSLIFCINSFMFGFVYFVSHMFPFSLSFFYFPLIFSLLLSPFILLSNILLFLPQCKSPSISLSYQFLSKCQLFHLLEISFSSSLPFSVSFLFSTLSFSKTL
ncbi:unnamed protein product [Acanthosepion pharaonis]|uniref:Uncharacterized protein n=1 Tax=Acanthosepion pharaonis TaxID=158019 RepID=A0A812E363_ACAPH|nr:unnamed protein product [Sepia pharaonis]